jgi:hypothetical protein
VRRDENVNRDRKEVREGGMHRGERLEKRGEERYEKEGCIEERGWIREVK